MTERRASDVLVECLEAASADDFGRHLRHALDLDGPSLIVLPIDYSVDLDVSSQLGETTARGPR